MNPHAFAGSLALVALLFQTGSLVAQQGLGGAAPPLPATLLECADLTTALRAATDQDTRLRDWANLTRYREANRTAGRPDVVFMGDSITDFWQQERFGGFFPGKNYADRGISAQTTSQMLVRFRPDVVALKPKAVVILAGTNDIAGNTGPMSNEDIQNNLASMSELAAASGVKVVLASITPVSAYHVANPTIVPQTTRRPVARVRGAERVDEVLRRRKQARVSRLLLGDGRWHRHAEDRNSVRTICIPTLPGTPSWPRWPRRRLGGRYDRDSPWSMVEGGHGRWPRDKSLEPKAQRPESSVRWW